MKTFSSYISERFINKYGPKDIFELRLIIEKRLENDKNADLTDIDVSQLTTFCDTTKGMYMDKGLFEDLDPHKINISNWDVSNVKDMRRVFFNCHNLECDVSKWDVSDAESMSNMFYDCNKFDCDLGNWKFPDCESLFGMFVKCVNFKGKGLENWDVSNVEFLAHMFNGCEKLQCDLSNWKLSPNLKENHYMFHDCTYLKQHKLIPTWA